MIAKTTELCKIKLYDQMPFVWENAGHVFLRGQLCRKGAAVHAAELESSLQGKGPGEIVNWLRDTGGCYQIIYCTPEYCVLIVDPCRTMPIFYAEEADGIRVYDHLGEEELRLFGLDEPTAALFQYMLCLPGTLTALTSVRQLQAGELLWYTKNGTYRERFYRVSYGDGLEQIQDAALAQKVVRFKLEAIIDRLPEQIAGRTVLLPLSGGHDSRLLLYCLKKAHVGPILSYTYGTRSCNEYSLSKKVAAYYQIPHLFIEYKGKKVRKYYQKNYSRYAEFAGNYTSVPWMQEWYALGELLRRTGLNPHQCVVVSGLGSDFWAGSQLEKMRLPTDAPTVGDVVREYARERMNISESNRTQEEEDSIRYAANVLLENAGQAGRDGFNAEELLEQLIWEEHIAKFLMNGLRVYEYHHLLWLVPFMDTGWGETWLSMDRSLRIKRKLWSMLEASLYDPVLRAIPFEQNAEPHFLQKHLPDIWSLLEKHAQRHPEKLGHVWQLVYLPKKVNAENYKENSGIWNAGVAFSAEYRKEVETGYAGKHSE